MKINTDIKVLCVICNINKVEPEVDGCKIKNPPICPECLANDDYGDLERILNKELENEGD